jgi:hypothetical protein
MPTPTFCLSGGGDAGDVEGDDALLPRASYKANIARGQSPPQAGLTCRKKVLKKSVCAAFGTGVLSSPFI